MKKMSLNTESVYWLSNKEWYRINKEKNCFEILESAPERAKMSFDLWTGRKRIRKKGYFSKLKNSI